ncbi:MAG: hypothetical protein ABL898_09555 [Hyphomicrobiaceae bacterium]
MKRITILAATALAIISTIPASAAPIAKGPMSIAPQLVTKIACDTEAKIRVCIPECQAYVVKNLGETWNANRCRAWCKSKGKCYS